MDLYHSRLTQDDLNDLIIKYKIPRDLHPQLPLEEFVMSELPNDVIDRADGDLRYPDAAIDDPRPAASSFSMADVRQLSTHVIKLRDMPEGVLVLSGLSRVWKSRVCDPVLQGANRNVIGIHDFLCLPEWIGSEVQEEAHLDVRSTLQRLPFYCTPLATTDAVILDPTPEDLAIGTPSSKILAKAEASQKRKASTSGDTSSHVAKRNRSSLAQSSGSTTRPSLFVGDSDDESGGDDDACVDIPLVIPLCSAAVIPFSKNQGGSSALEGSNTRDSRGKGIMVNDAAAPSVDESRPRPSSRPAPSFRDVSRDAIHANFFHFSVGPYYATYPEGGVAGNYEFTREEWDAPYRPTLRVLTKEVFKDPAVCKTVVDQFPTPGEMVRVESLFDDQLTAKMSVLHCMMMSHGGEIPARYRGLHESHHDATLKKQVSRINDKLYSSDASFAKSKAKGKERKKKIKSLTKSLDNFAKLRWMSLAVLIKAYRFEGRREMNIRSGVEGHSSRGELLSLAANAGF
ncbi:hypothetical protein Tco_0682694 [Tanacetum coccineum]|uniref:Uncharacterized protein n=1 Tax=Tanacetum coccineum TaxID=301880 RepID=A0ABQ4XS45_9ASTR